jgi:cob(II)yrinic acid a,c-diamide reductase
MKGVGLHSTAGWAHPDRAAIPGLRLLALLAAHIYRYGSSHGNKRLLKKIDVAPQTYRDAMARFAGAVHVVTTDGSAGRRGTTAIAACSVSDSPPTILVCLNRENPRNEAFLLNGKFALNTLSAGQQTVADAFSGLHPLTTDERFARAEWDRIETGAPALVGSLAVFDCEVADIKDIATHRILFGRVKGIRIGEGREPLLYFDRAYRELAQRP